MSWDAGGNAQRYIRKGVNIVGVRSALAAAAEARTADEFRLMLEEPEFQRDLTVTHKDARKPDPACKPDPARKPDAGSRWKAGRKSDAGEPTLATDHKGEIEIVQEWRV